MFGTTNGPAKAQGCFNRHWNHKHRRASPRNGCFAAKTPPQLQLWRGTDVNGGKYGRPQVDSNRSHAGESLTASSPQCRSKLSSSHRNILFRHCFLHLLFPFLLGQNLQSVTPDHWLHCTYVQSPVSTCVHLFCSILAHSVACGDTTRFPLTPQKMIFSRPMKLELSTFLVSGVLEDSQIHSSHQLFPKSVHPRLDGRQYCFCIVSSRRTRL